MATNRSRSKYTNDLIRDQYDRLSVLIPKGDKDRFREAAEALQLGDSINGAIASFITHSIARHESIKAESESQQAVSTAEASYLLGYTDGTTRKAISRGQLKRPDGDSSKVLLSSVVARAEARGLDISDKLTSLKQGKGQDPTTH